MRSALAAILLVASARAAAADPPIAATRALMTQLGDGTVPAASLIDPATGAWIVEGDRATHVCDPTELLELAAEVRIDAATWADDAACVDHAADAGCDLPERVSGVPFTGATLRFDRGSRGLVLRVVVRGEAGAAASIDRAATCAGAAALPTEPPPVIAAARRERPARGKTPTVATPAMIRALARGAWKLDAFADRARGLTIVYQVFAADDASGDRDERVCGAAIHRELVALRASMASIVSREHTGDADVSCTNDASTSTCLLHENGEYGDNLRLHFRQTDRGLVLDAWSNFDENGVLVHATEPHDVLVARALVRAWVAPCPRGD